MARPSTRKSSPAPQKRINSVALYIRDLCLWWAAIDSPELMPSIHVVTYCCVGLSALLITVFAFMGGFFIGWKSSSNIFGGMIGGGLAGAFVFSIDRYILASEIPKNESKEEKRKKLWLRLGLSLCTAIIISTPVEVWMFSNSIRLHQMLKINNDIVQLTTQYNNIRKGRYRRDPETQQLVENKDIVESYKRLDSQIKAKQARLALLNQGKNTEEMDFMEQLLTNWKVALNVKEHPEHTIIHFGLFALLIFIDMLPALLKNTKIYDRYDELRAKKADKRVKEIENEIELLHTEEMQQIHNNHVIRMHELTQDFYEKLKQVNQKYNPATNNISTKSPQQFQNPSGNVKQQTGTSISNQPPDSNNVKSQPGGLINTQPPNSTNGNGRVKTEDDLILELINQNWAKPDNEN